MAVSLTQIRERIETDLSDSMLTLIRDSETEAVERAHGGSGAVETHNAKGTRKLVLRRKPVTFTSVKERRTLDDDSVTLSANDYRQIGDRVLYRLTDGDNPENDWSEEVVIDYTADIDQNLRDRVILGLVDLAVEFGAYESESVGDWKGSQKDYDKRRRDLLAQINEPSLPFV